MSKASERRAAKDTLALYPLMTVPELAAFLSCSTDHARGLCEDRVIPCSNIGRGQRREYRIDPFQAAIYQLAQEEGLSVDEYWERHGPEGTPERAARFVARARQIMHDRSVA